ncbi:MAG: GntR family transcriptional regulator [Actinobacteria bacterium]|nr:GntR family transcriptional regulator [Actinomycetota bacterium]
MRPTVGVTAERDGDAKGRSEPRGPKYFQLKRALVDELMRTLPPGAAIPPERTLAEDFSTSRTTVRQALQELVAEGRLERHQGRGTFIAQPKVSQLLQLTSHTEDMRAQGLEPSSRLVDVDTLRADARLAERLEIRRGMRVVRIERLRMANGEPMALEATHLADKRFPGLARLLAGRSSLYELLAEEYGVTLSNAEETIETATADPREADLLGTEVGMPLLLLSRHSFDQDESPVEWVRSVYRGDRYKLVARLRRPD